MVNILPEKNSAFRVYAIITAAGSGSRMKSSINKQYIELMGIPVLARTIMAFQNCDKVDGIIIVINEKDIIYCKKNIIDKYNLCKVKKIVAGGAERQISVFNGLKSIQEDECDVVLIHDGARPFIGNKHIEACIDAVFETGACGVGVKVKDTLKVADENNFVSHTPDRSKLWSIQTPQAFFYPAIMEAHQAADEEGFVGTDDLMLVERMGTRAKIVEGSYINIKITTPEDMIFGEAILNNQAKSY